MINIGALRGLDGSSLNDLSAEIAIADDSQIISPTEKSIELFRSFNNKIKDFLFHLDGLLTLIDPKSGYEDFFGIEDLEEQIANAAHQMNRAIFEARKNLNEIDCRNNDNDLHSRATDIYSKAHNYYYEEVRPNIFGLADLDLPDLEFFASKSHPNGETKIFIRDEHNYCRRYQNALISGLEHLVHPEEYETQIKEKVLEKDKIYTSKELNRLIKDLETTATKLLPSRMTRVNFSTDFKKFVESLNRIFSDKSFEAKEISRMLYGKTSKFAWGDTYEILINRLISNLARLPAMTDTNTMLSERVKIILLLHLMHQKAIYAK